MPEMTVQERTLFNMLSIRMANRLWGDAELHKHEKAILQKANTTKDMEWIGLASTSVADILRWLEEPKLEAPEPEEPKPVEVQPAPKALAPKAPVPAKSHGRHR